MDALEGIEIPDPFDVREFAQRVGEKRGREVRLVAKSVADGPCGACFPAREVDYVFYEPNTGAFHRDHIVLHELGHLLLAHEPGGLWSQYASALLPDLDLDVIATRVLTRASLGEVAEQEAELLATLVHEHVHRRGGGALDLEGTEDELAARLRVALGTQGRRIARG